MKAFAAIALLIILAGCDDAPACKDEKSSINAMAAYGQCIMMKGNVGGGEAQVGLDCGMRAFKTYCLPSQ